MFAFASQREIQFVIVVTNQML